MKKTNNFVLSIIFVFSYLTLNAQVAPPPIPPPPPPGLPIDSGVIFLLISGIIYGVKKLRD